MKHGERHFPEVLVNAQIDVAIHYVAVFWFWLDAKNLDISHSFTEVWKQVKNMTCFCKKESPINNTNDRKDRENKWKLEIGIFD